MPISAELGYIKLEIHEVMLVGETSYTGKRTLPEPDKIHERSKKAVGHRVRCVRLHVLLFGGINLGGLDSETKFQASIAISSSLLRFVSFAPSFSNIGLLVGLSYCRK